MTIKQQYVEVLENNIQEYHSILEWFDRDTKDDFFCFFDNKYIEVENIQTVISIKLFIVNGNSLDILFDLTWCGSTRQESFDSAFTLLAQYLLGGGEL